MIEYDSILRAVKKVLEREEGVVAAYLFGSFVERRITAGSDLDVAVLFRRRDATALLDLTARLSRAAGMEADVLSLNGAAPVIAMQVLRKGLKIVDREPRVTAEFIVKTLGFYADLKIVRKVVERSILNGRIYGRP